MHYDKHTQHNLHSHQTLERRFEFWLSFVLTLRSFSFLFFLGYIIYFIHSLLWPFVYFTLVWRAMAKTRNARRMGTQQHLYTSYVAACGTEYSRKGRARCYLGRTDRYEETEMRAERWSTAGAKRSWQGTAVYSVRSGRVYHPVFGSIR